MYLPKERQSFSSNPLLRACSVFLIFILARGASFAAEPAVSKRVIFSQDVRPILATNCFLCHGSDAGKRMSGLRLDAEEGAFKKLDSGKIAIVPRNPAASEMLERITSHSDDRMPPESTGKKLTPDQVMTLRHWIEQGAQYDKHWAFVAPKRPAVPAVKTPAWCRNPIDRFILARLEAEGMKPSPEADRMTLIRRLSLDLTGLPPTLEDVDRFVADKDPDAYERLVDHLLDSPAYGEKMALKWLDLARYADTHGFHIDSQRDMWRWRDWVIDAFNHNKPYDQFIVEQLAGDLLPHPTLDQRVATGFNRNHPIDFEGGAIPEEYQAAYIIDRIDTTASTFMGLTLRCGQCHDHKYDPFPQKDYYKMYAFFNNIAENGLDGQSGNAVPFIKAPYPGQEFQLASLDRKVHDTEGAIKARATEAASAQAEWEKSALAMLAKSPPVTSGLVANYTLDEATGDSVADAAGKAPKGKIQGKADWAKGKIGGALQFDGDTYVEIGDAANFDRTDKYSYGAWVYPTSGDAGSVVSKMDDGNNYRGWDMYLSGGQVFIHLVHEWDKNAIRINAKTPIEMNRWTHLFVSYDGSGKASGLKLFVNGMPVEVDATHDTLTDTIKTDKPLRIGKRNASAAFKGMIDDVRIYDRVVTPEEVKQLAELEPIRSILSKTAESRSKAEKESLTQYFLDTQDEPYKKLQGDLATAKKNYSDYDATVPTTMVMQERDKQRETHILLRGQYDQLGEVVTPDTPTMLPPMRADLPKNRLGLAKWLVDPQHPLTARVAVNRFWQTYFGTGLVKTAEDFGTQGERPSHPELLDWLATEFIRTGWDIKAMQRLIVTSAAYRQSSRATPEMLEKDPEDRLLERAPRYRLQAELVRDLALDTSGLLVTKIGGPSVKPYQPAGLWEEMSFGAGFSAQTYEQDHGDALYRRAMYTFWKRTVPPPSLQTFDAPEREYCIVRRSVTNTPLQALVLMNDPTYVEASRHLAERMMTEAPSSPTERLRYGFRLATCRYPNDAELSVLMTTYNQQGVTYHKDKDAAMKLLGVGESPHNEKLDPSELAAYTSVASVILNLDETITRS